MRHLILSMVLLLSVINAKGQEEKELSVLQADSTWGVEVIKFPLGFAREIPYEGFEDIRFAKGWAKADSPEFWTYVFAWQIKGIQKQSVALLETHLAMYFDGLSRPDTNDTRVFPMATVIFIESEKTNAEADYVGKLRVYDRFHTKEMITLYCQVKAHYCEDKNSSTILFEFSKQPQEHTVWQKFKAIKLRDDLCNE